MKRAKIALVAIAAFAIVGGVYASKAKRGLTLYSTTFPGLVATAPLADATITTTTTITKFTYVTTTSGGIAVKTRTIFAD